MAEWRDEQWSRTVDNAIILMSLVVTRHLLTKWPGDKRIMQRIAMRMDRLIREYKNPSHEE